jgi:hypothetical protein
MGQVWPMDQRMKRASLRFCLQVVWEAFLSAASVICSTLPAGHHQASPTTTGPGTKVSMQQTPREESAQEQSVNGLRAFGLVALQSM